jgi:hypothetical protein
MCIYIYIYTYLCIYILYISGVEVGYKTPTVALQVVEGDERAWGHNCIIVSPVSPGWGVDERLKTLLCKKGNVCCEVQRSGNSMKSDRTF